MIDITSIHIHYRDLNGKRHVKKIKPTNPQNTLAIKQDIGEAVERLRNTGKNEYYYAVIEIDRDGKPAYRTVIPKTLF